MELLLTVTRFVKRATPNASYVAGNEFAAGAKILRAKVEPLAPRIVCFVGLVGYRQGLDKHATLGVQEVHWGRADLFIVPSTSPRNARYRPEIVTWFRRLKKHLNEKKNGTQTHTDLHR